LILVLLILPAAAVAEPLESVLPVEVSAKSAILIDAKTGTVIAEKNADEKREAASITKLMTALICLEAVKSGERNMSDMVMVSKYAAGQEGSEAILDAGSEYSFESLLMSMIMASANDSAVALAENISGSEGAFADKMNARAAALGLSNTRYMNCTGLPMEGHLTTARDIAALAREVCRHDEYFKYSSVWLSSLAHPGGRVTDLTNTNRLVRFYDKCDGLKTGSTQAAKYCIAATAQADGMRVIAVCLSSESGQKRFNEARALLEYALSAYHMAAPIKKNQKLDKEIKVKRGSKDSVKLMMGGGVSLLEKKGHSSEITMELELETEVKAPVSEGQALGIAAVIRDGEVIARLPVVAAESVSVPDFVSSLVRLLAAW
ncbi:MAG: D-alanyl-D-alanine carboxypeptidase, partial [Eubacteriales bacterium]|nr:D-alanyl-D-alanine carboxypeptidase [Eubacteriales bacterium]